MKILRDLRKEKSKTQLQMAQILGISQQAYATYETDRAQPPMDILMKLADFFQVSIDYLLGRSDEKNYSPLPNLEIPDNLKDARVAFYGGIEDLTQEDLEDVSRYIEFVKSKKRK